jgi:hypothetical protein
VREDPIITGGWIKAALVILVAGALGVGAYVLASGVDVNLPDLPDLSTTSDTATSLSDTNLESTTVGQDRPPPPAQPDQFSSAGLGSAINEVQGEIGSGQQLTRLTINDTQTQFIVRRGDGIEAYGVRADGGDLTHQDASITISGNATIDDFAFGLDGAQPSAVNRMLASARKLSGASDFKPTVLTLDRQIPFGSKELRWTINAEGGGRNLTYKADATGGHVQDIGAGGTPIPPAVQRAQRVNDCIQAAGGDVDKISACVQQLQP